MTSISNTMLEARLRLYDVPRWSAAKMSIHQSVAEHIIRVCWMLKCMPLDDYNETVMFALYHEDDEALSGCDIPSHVKKHIVPKHNLSDNDYNWFKFCDIAEAWLFAVEHCRERYDKRLNILNKLAIGMSEYSSDDKVYQWLSNHAYTKVVPKNDITLKSLGGVTALLDTGGRFNGKNIAIMFRCNHCGSTSIGRKSDITSKRYKSCGCNSPSINNNNPHFIKKELVGRISIDPVTQCWEWQGSTFKQGYGRFTAMGQVQAHRVSYVLYKGDIPDEMFVCHVCDNPCCVNPEHLFLGSAKDNVMDCVSKGRHVSLTGESHPMCKLSDNDVRIIRKSDLSMYKLAEQYDVVPQTISKIKLKQSRKKVG